MLLELMVAIIILACPPIAEVEYTFAINIYKILMKKMVIVVNVSNNAMVIQFVSR